MASVSPGHGCRVELRIAEVLPQVAFEHLGHQSVDGATDGGDLLQDGQAFALLLDRALERRGLALDAADAGEQLLAAMKSVCHGAIVEGRSRRDIYWGAV